jgi:hypothetical protein
VTEESTEPTSEIPSQPPKDEVKKKKQKKKSPKPDAKAQQIPAPETSQVESADNQKVAPYLQYLQLYHHDRSNWKFQSIQQKQLLKNIFNLYRIPDAYTPALANYVSGLKSLGSRILLAKQADEILQQFHSAHSSEPLNLTMESLGARKQAYEAALRRAQEEHRARGGKNSEYEDDQLQEARNERIRAERAEAILFEALNLELDTKLISAVCTEATNDADNAEEQVTVEDQNKGKRKRKARTHVSDDESSSSSSSSSSESDSESDEESDDGDEKEATTPSKKQKKVKTAKPEPIFGSALLNRVFGKKDAKGQAAASSSSDVSSSEDESTSDESSDSDDDTSTSSASTSEESSDESS